MSPLVSLISASDEQRYPESVRKIYIVNPPGIFSMAMGLLKPFLDERTLQKFQNGTASDFNEEWKVVIGEENLPKYLKGSLDWAPEHHNIKELMEAKGIRPVKLSIPRRGDHYAEVKANKGQTVHYQIMIKRSDLSVGLMAADKKTDVVAKTKIDSDKSPWHFSHTVTEDGTYYVFLDNSDSPMLGRKVKILTWVKDPFVPKAKVTEEKAKDIKDTKSPRKTKSSKEKKEKKEKK